MNGHGLPEPAMQLWRDYGDLLRRELGPLGAANWQLGGGTVLAKDWPPAKLRPRHHNSNDGRLAQNENGHGRHPRRVHEARP